MPLLSDNERAALDGMLANLEHEAGDVDDLAPLMDADEDAFWAYHSYWAIKKLLGCATLPEDAGWRPIESAPKGDNAVLAPAILLGYAPDETGYSPRSVEGYWSHERARWNWAHDPYFDCPQPTHWQPLPAAPATGQEGSDG